MPVPRLALLSAVLTVLAAGPAPGADGKAEVRTLEIGAPAPEFDLPGVDGRTCARDPTEDKLEECDSPSCPQDRDRASARRASSKSRAGSFHPSRVRCSSDRANCHSISFDLDSYLS